MLEDFLKSFQEDKPERMDGKIREEGHCRVWDNIWVVGPDQGQDSMPVPD